MLKKKKFNPVVTRVKLNPEQAVLTCEGFDWGYRMTFHQAAGFTRVCNWNWVSDRHPHFTRYHQYVGTTSS
jgi:hypothetical protein